MLRKIGRREFIDLPDLGMHAIEGKVDTGAFRTALHCTTCREIEQDGQKVLEAIFNLDGSGDKVHYFRSYRLRLIRNSFGQSEERYCIRTTLRIGKKRILSDVTLSDRSGMKFQVLIGRKTIGKKFLVDVSSIHLLQKNKKR
jgi:hypothetical protein